MRAGVEMSSVLVRAFSGSESNQMGKAPAMASLNITSRYALYLAIPVKEVKVKCPMTNKCKSSGTLPAQLLMKACSGNRMRKPKGLGGTAVSRADFGPSSLACPFGPQYQLPFRLPSDAQRLACSTRLSALQQRRLQLNILNYCAPLWIERRLIPQ